MNAQHIRRLSNATPAASGQANHVRKPSLPGSQAGGQKRPSLPGSQASSTSIASSRRSSVSSGTIRARTASALAVHKPYALPQHAENEIRGVPAWCLTNCKVDPAKKTVVYAGNGNQMIMMPFTDARNLASPFSWGYLRRVAQGRSSDTDLGFILPLVRTEGNKFPLEVAVTFQYQPCVNAITVELPGALITGNYTPKQTALHALRSDTGFSAHNSSKVSTEQKLFNDCGINSSSSRLSQVNIHLTQGAREGKTTPWRNSSGIKETRLVPFKHLTDFLLDCNASNVKVCARLFHVAHGLRLGMELLGIPLPRPRRRAAIRVSAPQGSIKTDVEQHKGPKAIVRTVQYELAGKQGVADVIGRNANGRTILEEVTGIIPKITRTDTRECYTIIVIQFRPATGGLMAEFPAGLIDPNETAIQAGARELREETGFLTDIAGSGIENPKSQGETKRVSPILWLETRNSSCNMVLTQADIQVNESQFNNLRTQKLDKQGEVTVEYLERKVVPLLKLYDILKGYEKQGINVCARLWHLAYGIHLAQKLRTELV